MHFIDLYQDCDHWSNIHHIKTHCLSHHDQHHSPQFAYLNICVRLCGRLHLQRTLIFCVLLFFCWVFTEWKHGKLPRFQTWNKVYFHLSCWLLWVMSKTSKTKSWTIYDSKTFTVYRAMLFMDRHFINRDHWTFIFFNKAHIWSVT